MKELIIRDTVIVQRGVLIENIKGGSGLESVRLQLKSKTWPLDVGSFAFTVREKTKNNIGDYSLPIMVDIDSFLPSRIELLEKLLDKIYLYGGRDATINDWVAKCRQTLNWCDTNGFETAFESPENAYCAYKKFTNELVHKIKLNEGFTPENGTKKQRGFRFVLELVFGFDEAKNICQGITLIRFKREHSDAAEENHVKYILKTHLSLARSLADNILNNAPFPFRFKVNEVDVLYWHVLSGTAHTKYRPLAVATQNQKEGRIATVDEYKRNLRLNTGRKVGNWEAKKELSGSHESLDRANSTEYHNSRLMAASLSMQCYLMVFMLLTNMGRSEAVELQFDKNFEVDKDFYNRDFRTVKFRSRGRITSYNLGSKHGLSMFKEYLKIRRWVLNDKECKYLFFSMGQKQGRNYSGDFFQLKQDRLSKVHDKIKGIYIPKDIPNIKFSRVRKYKTLILNELKVDQRLIADILNHTVETNHKVYATGDPDKQKKELGVFWKALHGAAKQVKGKKVLEHEVSVAAGHCEDMGNAIPVTDGLEINPDCKSQYGCLFCKHFACHADREDIEKLYSLLYVVDCVKQLSNNVDRSHELFDPLVARINLIFSEMKNISDEVKQLMEDVEKSVMVLGVLTPFWELKLQRLEDLGVTL